VAGQLCGETSPPLAQSGSGDPNLTNSASGTSMLILESVPATELSFRH